QTRCPPGKSWIGAVRPSRRVAVCAGPLLKIRSFFDGIMKSRLILMRSGRSPRLEGRRAPVQLVASGRLSRRGVAHGPPQPFRGQRHVEMVDPELAERIDDGVD